MDYNTYWIWKAINGYSPRLIIIEYNSSIPPTESKTVKYDPGAIWDETDYFGASLLALVKLGQIKGYTLIGCDKRGINAFFIRNDLTNHFIIKDIKKLFRYGKKVNGYIGGHPPSDKLFITV